MSELYHLAQCNHVPEPEPLLMGVVCLAVLLVLRVLR